MLFYQAKSIADTSCPELFPDCLDISVDNIVPIPNYPLSKDLEDKAQLTDGFINRDPIWVRSKSVAWQHQTPVSFSLNLENAEFSPSKYSMYLRFGHGAKSGVHMPRFIDVFSNKLNRFTRIGAHYNHKVSSYLSASSWVEIPLSELSNHIEVLVHSEKIFISIDEIVISKSSLKDVKVDELVSDYSKKDIDIDSLTMNSIGMLKLILTKKNNITIVKKSDSEINVVCLELEDPWSKIDKEVCNFSKNKLHRNIFIKEKDYFVFKVFNESDVLRELKINQPRNSNVSIGELNEVLVADGSRAFDPITPMEGQIIIEPYEKKIFFVSVEFMNSECTDVCLDRYSLSLSLGLSDLVAEVDYSVVDLNTDNPSKYQPNVVTWGYSRDKPIWSVPEKNVADLKSHGVNVFLVHPHYLPSPYDAESLSVNNFLRLVNELKLYKDQGLLLLYVGIDGWHKHKFKEKPTDSEWVDWLKVVKKAINVAGINSLQWSVFLIDEPASSELELLSEIASDLKSIDNRISIYANPISSSSKTTRIQDLLPLIGLVDIWQPSMKFAQSRVWDKFKKNIDQFWVYGGPDSPVKSALPSVYRELSHEAILVGATGIGFWSYSDTSGSSAWDDFDGRRPDWSVVYEIEDGIISSRRWEAFAKGIEEYKISHELSQENVFIGLGNAKSISHKIKTDRVELFRSIEKQLNDK